MPPTFPPGSRLRPRPDAVAPCPDCGEITGRGYPSCPGCAGAVDAFWSADWAALLTSEGVTPGGVEERELAQFVLAEVPGAHPWTCVDQAMRLLKCDRCGAELGTGELSCVPCTVVDQGRWAWDHTGMPGAMTYNEHLLRVSVAALRAPHRHRDTVVAFHRLVLPFVLVGEPVTPVQAQRVRAHVLAERVEELAAYGSFAAMASAPDLPWRVTT